MKLLITGASGLLGLNLALESLLAFPDYIAFFNAGHEIRAVETFNFISRHFNWPPTANP